ncbi:MAG: hypothetical protein HOW73_47785 [Polyangiaceae bacterium]|nr:hypothetical protein [Polyangiaceae bacterium]
MKPIYLREFGDSWLVDELRIHMLPWGIRNLAELERAAAFCQMRLQGEKDRDGRLGSSVLAWASGEGLTLTVDEGAHKMATEWVRRAVWPLCPTGTEPRVTQAKVIEVPKAPRRGS